MKLLLGDNQFFGINHTDLKKAEEVRKKFPTEAEIISFIKEASSIGLNGFMINSNDLGAKVVEKAELLNSSIECHYSIPYPHKYASLVNEDGIISLLLLVLRKSSFSDIWNVIKFAITFDANFLLPISLKMEVPNNLPKGSVVYLQNIVTDLVIGLPNGKRLISSFIKHLDRMGYIPGIITLNPKFVFEKLVDEFRDQNIHLCFNMNVTGFNVMPSVMSVEETVSQIKKTSRWKIVAMSIFSSGIDGLSYKESIEYIKKHPVDFVVFGSSRLENIRINKEAFDD